jgi:hypothetical protein
MLRAAGGALLAAGAVGAWPASAQAQTAAATPVKEGPTPEQRASARAAYDAGTQAFSNGEFTEAVEYFKEANRIIPSPQAQYWIAESLDKMSQRDDAIVAFESFLADPKVERAGEEKVTAAKERLEQLKAERAKAEADALALAAEQQKAQEEPVEPPPDLEPSQDDDQWKPVELGVFAGVLLMSAAHNLHDDASFRRAYSDVAVSFGVRAGYYPIKFFGIEAEYLHAEGKVEKVNNSASFNSARGHVVGQLPLGTSPVALYATLGGGFMQANSKANGADLDPLLQAGAGVKLSATKNLRLRLAYRQDFMQRVGGGISFSKEVLLGGGWAF